MFLIRLVSIIFLFFPIIFSNFAQNYLKSLDLKPPQNIILMISDGCGLNHIQATNLYQYGELERQVYEKFPIRIFMSTYSAKNYKNDYNDKDFIWFTGYNSHLTWSDFNWRKKGTTCSGAAATAMATGFKTYNGAIGVGLNNENLFNLTELAKSLGKSTGVITSVPFSHATPAGFVAHNKSRENYSEIAKDMLFNSKIDVIIGCGHPYYDNNGEKSEKAISFDYVGDSLIWVWLHNNQLNCMTLDSIIYTPQDCDGDSLPDKWKLIESKNEFEILENGTIPKRLLGIPTVHETLQYGRSGELNAEPFKVPLNNNVPNLSSLVKTGINALDNNSNGFFLMIEGGAIDWASHSNKIGRLIEEEMDFNSAVEVVVEWIEKNSSWNETLLIVTSDHETGYLTGPDYNVNNIESYYVQNQGKGLIPIYKWNHTGHTNTLVPVYAKGCGAEMLNFFADETDIYFGRYIDNTDIAKMIFLLWR